MDLIAAHFDDLRKVMFHMHDHFGKNSRGYMIMDDVMLHGVTVPLANLFCNNLRQVGFIPEKVIIAGKTKDYTVDMVGYSVKDCLCRRIIEFRRDWRGG